MQPLHKETYSPEQVLLAFVLLGETETALTYACLLPIVGGVALASMGDMTFSALAFGVVQVSNLGFSGRAVFVKQLKSAHKASASAKDDVELFLHVHVLGLVFLVPAVATELAALWAVATPELLFNLGGTMTINGVFYTTYNLFSFLVLSRVSASVHAVLNVFRRVVVITCTTLFFATPMGTQNVVGVVIAIAGVLLFTWSKRPSPAKKAA